MRDNMTVIKRSARILQTIGDPLDRSTQHGPQNHLAHLEKLVEYVETGVKEGEKSRIASPITSY